MRNAQKGSEKDLLARLTHMKSLPGLFLLKIRVSQEPLSQNLHTCIHTPAPLHTCTHTPACLPSAGPLRTFFMVPSDLWSCPVHIQLPEPGGGGQESQQLALRAGVGHLHLQHGQSFVCFCSPGDRNRLVKFFLLQFRLQKVAGTPQTTDLVSSLCSGLTAITPCMPRPPLVGTKCRALDESCKRPSASVLRPERLLLYLSDLPLCAVMSASPRGEYALAEYTEVKAVTLKLKEAV